MNNKQELLDVYKELVNNLSNYETHEHFKKNKFEKYSLKEYETMIFKSIKSYDDMRKEIVKYHELNSNVEELIDVINSLTKETNKWN